MRKVLTFSVLQNVLVMDGVSIDQVEADIALCEEYLARDRFVIDQGAERSHHTLILYLTIILYKGLSQAQKIDTNVLGEKTKG